MGWMIPKDAGEETGLSRQKLFAICGMLMMASAINYMDRQTLAAVSKRITEELSLSETQYGNIETSFGWSFALGSLFFGLLADYVSVRWLYPIVLLLWSIMGFLTGLTESYEGLLVCRGLLGFFEAGHWPCGLKTTQAILGTKSRAMGNSVLQSGTSIGAILTPLFMLLVLSQTGGNWRLGFQIVGAAGILWIVAWGVLVSSIQWNATPSSKLQNQQPTNNPGRTFGIKLAVVLVVVTVINITWQILRAWLPKYLQTGLGYSEQQSLIYNSIWFFSTDVGCILSGASALWLASQGWSIKRSRGTVFAVCAFLCSIVSWMPLLPDGALRLVLLAFAGAGALGMFPLYYSFSQDLTKNHMGKIVGITGICAWALPTQTLFGYLKDKTGNYNTGLVITGLLPLAGLLAIVFFWPEDDKQQSMDDH